VDVHVDWLSWTEPEPIAPRNQSELYTTSKSLAKERFGDAYEILFDGQGIDTAVARQPYRVSVSRDDNGFQVYGNSHTDTTLFELRGRGCERIHGEVWAQDFVNCLHDKCTRLDLAADIVTVTTPADFARQRDNKRFRSISFIRSATGETVYVGSPKSDRFCRIYRYNPPHPRSHLLRVEFVTRRKLAKSAALQFADAPSPNHFAAQLGNSYGFSHPDWKPGVVTDERLRVPILERKDSDTVNWLYKQVAPAISRLMTETEFDIVEFLDYVYGLNS
jgi:hypothetical protein